MSNSYEYPEVPQAYVGAATAAQENQLDMRFLNDSPFYAKLLADLMVGRAAVGGSVVIFTGALHKDCYIDAIRDSKASQIKILAQDEVELRKNLANLSEDARSSLTVKILPNEFKDENVNHFFVSGNSYRYELDDEKATAVANFNDKISAENLIRIFNMLWDKGVSISIK